jgi:acetyl esterase/lipase
MATDTVMNLDTSFSLGPLTVPLTGLLLAVFVAAAFLVARFPLRHHRRLRAKVTGSILDALVIFVVAGKLTPAILHPARLFRDPLPLLMAPPGMAGVGLGLAAGAAWVALAVFRRQRLRRAALLPVLLFAGVVTVGVAVTQLGTALRPPGAPAAGLTLVSLDGTMHSVTDYRGRVVVVNFWATWCPPCRAELPDLAAFAGGQGPDGAVLLSVDLTNTEPSEEAVRTFAADNGMRFPVLLDRAGDVAAAWDVSAYPTTFIIDPRGRVSARHVGAVSSSWLRREVRIAGRQAQRAAAAPGVAPGATLTGIVYRVVGGKELKLDLERPATSSGARPAVVFLCGNGWGYTSTFDRTEFEHGLGLAVAHGYVGVTVDYSSTRPNRNDRPMGAFPAQVYDVKSAIRFLRANAVRFGIDPDRIAVVGHSSGGTLALMLGLTRPEDGLEGTDAYAGVSSSVQAVINYAGPTELARDYAATPGVDSAYVGGTPTAVPDLYRKASPLTYARPGAPPILTIHGDKDTASLPEQALLLDARMKEVGGAHTLVIRKGAGHMDFSLADPAAWDFLARVLQ